MKSAGQWAEPCWTSSWSGVWPSGVLRCDVSDLVSWKRRKGPGRHTKTGLPALRRVAFDYLARYGDAEERTCRIRQMENPGGGNTGFSDKATDAGDSDRSETSDNTHR